MDFKPGFQANSKRADTIQQDTVSSKAEKLFSNKKRDTDMDLDSPVKLLDSVPIQRGTANFATMAYQADPIPVRRTTFGTLNQSHVLSNSRN